MRFTALYVQTRRLGFSRRVAWATAKALWLPKEQELKRTAGRLLYEVERARIKRAQKKQLKALCKDIKERGY